MHLTHTFSPVNHTSVCGHSAKVTKLSNNKAGISLR